MGKEAQIFKDKGTFEPVRVSQNPLRKSLISFVWPFKRKINSTGELIKCKATLRAREGIKKTLIFGVRVLQ